MTSFFLILPGLLPVRVSALSSVRVLPFLQKLHHHTPDLLVLPAPRHHSVCHNDPAWDGGPTSKSEACNTHYPIKGVSKICNAWPYCFLRVLYVTWCMLQIKKCTYNWWSCLGLSPIFCKSQKTKSLAIVWFLSVHCSVDTRILRRWRQYTWPG